ncbi:MAG: phosphotransferase [Actinobacteria bacterium]|nr:phosphotransferase [Actinomycetota bacterium]
MIDGLADLLPGHLARQRWFAGSEPEKVEVVEHDRMGERLHWLLVEADGARYQLLIGRADHTTPESVHGNDSAVVGPAGGQLYYDALLDPELAKDVLHRLAPDEEVSRVRPMGGEQSNSSVVFDERLVLKVFRRIHEGPNPDIEVTTALGEAGFPHVAAPIAAWERAGAFLGVVQPFLGGGTDGWLLALTSLRDLYAGDCEDPSECGGDFGAEAKRLGNVTGRMHVALAGAFESQAGDPEAWLAVMEHQLDRVGAGREWEPQARKMLAQVRAVPDPPAIRVHGDYHLGQVLRTDTGWFVLDFEGEPARPLEERRQPSSPLKDVAGMIRSFDYASAVALRERPEEERPAHLRQARAWAERNRRSFLDGYLATEGVAGLLGGDSEDVVAALAAWELDKAIYELGYELAHRPDWVEIPEAAISRLVSGLED